MDYKNDYLVRYHDSTSDEYKIFVDCDSDFWIWNSKGINVYYVHDKRWEKLNSTADSNYRLSGDHVRSIVNDNYGRIWIAIEHGGINIIDKKSATIRYVQHSETDDRSLIENSVYNLYSDTCGGMWAGTFKRGISYYNPSMFRFNTDHFPEFNHIPDFIPDVNSLTEDNYGNIYIGLAKGIIILDYQKREKRHIPLPPSMIMFPNDVILSMESTSYDKLWLGTYQSGLMTYEANTFTHVVLDPENKSSAANKTVSSIVQDESGYLWIGTGGAGLWGMDPLTGKITHYHDRHGNTDKEHISSICLSKDGNLYLATPYGMRVYHPMTNSYEKLLGNRKNDTSFSHMQMTQVFEDSRGLLWVATHCGLNVYDRRSDKIIILPEELGSSVIYGVVEDDDKTMWVAASSGVYHVIVSGKEAFYDYTIRKYGAPNTIDNQQFNPRAVIKTSEGKIALGGVSGLSVMDPKRMNYDTPVSKINFTDISILNKSIRIDSLYHGNHILNHAINHTDEIKLNHDQNIFSITFSSMDYFQMEKPGYMYMLEGFDSEWIFTNDNKVTYTNLVPGTYTLRVRTVNEDGIAANDTAELKIVITPPFYKSVTAYIIYAILAICALLLARGYLRHNEAQRYKLMQIQQDARHKHEIDDMKLRFFTNISHDLRTPLTLIITPLEYLIEHADNSDFRNKLIIAHNNAMRLLDMVNQLLDFRKSDIAGHTFNASSGDIVDTIHTICNNFVEYSEQRNINLTFFSPVKSFYMMFDLDKISKIIMNLLSNAFKFTPPGGRVDVSLDIIPGNTDKPEMLEIKVADNGCGISDEYKELVFQRFYQVPGNENKSISGSGVGLNLVKEFITLHKGTIKILDNVGKGTVFIINIPVDKCNNEQNASNNDINIQHEIKQSTKALNNNDQTGSTDNKKEKECPVILIVDDNDDFRMFLKDCLSAEYKVYDASNGAKAWEIIPELQPDIIISDVMMPEMDGNELCRLVKNDIRTSHILVILLTARAAKEHEKKGLEVGADDYITKPFNLSILTLRVKNLLQHRHDSHNMPMEVSPSKINVTSLDEKLINKAIQYVEDNLNRSDLSVEELSNELGMSRVHLYKKLLSITGKTPIEFIRVLRLKRAAQLLKESQMSISEIAYQTGFNSLDLFRKYFKIEFGLVPSEYQSKYGDTYKTRI